MQTKSFLEPVQALVDPSAQEIRGHVESRLPALSGHTTVTRLVTDIPNPVMQQGVLDILRLLKIHFFLDVLCEMDLITREEEQELTTYMYHLHALTERGERS